MAAFSLRPHAVSRLCTSVLIPSTHKDTRCSGVQPTQTISFQPNYVFKDPISKYCHIVMCWESELPRVHLAARDGGREGAHNLTHNDDPEDNVHRAECVFSDKQ